MPDKRFQAKKKPSRSKPQIALLIILVLLLAGSAVMFWPPAEKIKQGLDVQGGLSVVLEASNPDGSAVSADDMAVVQQVIERRVNLLGASETNVQVQGTNQLLVQIPGIVEQTQALQTIGQTGILEFVNVADITDESIQEALNAGQTYLQIAIDPATGQPVDETKEPDLPNGPIDPATESVTPTVDDSTQETQETQETQYTYSAITLTQGEYTNIFTGSNITSVNIGLEGKTSRFYAVNITLDGTATQAFAEVTRALYPTNGRIAIVLDGVVQSAPAVNDAITDGDVAITGNYDLDGANSLKTILQSGSLPVGLKVINSQMVGPTLGQDSLRAGILVAAIGLILVAAYLLLFYRGIGFLTAGAVAVFAVLYLGVLGLLSFFNLFSLSLAGIAGIVLAIGVAADSSILVLERFKEEIRMGRSVRASSITGVKHAIVTSIDADFVTLISALALFFIGIGSVKGFGLTLALGVVCDIAAMLLFKAPLVRLLAPKVIARHPGFWGIREDEDIARASGELKRGVAHG
ncbi:MAG: protein translocase subunit SecD [Coriobacteriales bacterium]|nr:protein translocase subunit SecD [Coriobacteriales bacterium]